MIYNTFKATSLLTRADGVTFLTGDGSTDSAQLVDRFGNPISSDKLKRVDAIHRTDWQGRQLLSPVARTNLIPHSGEIGGTGWLLVTGATVTATVDAPDGTDRASRLLAGTSPSSRAQSSANIAVSANTVYRASCMLRYTDSLQSSIAIFNGIVNTGHGRLDIIWNGGIAPAFNISAGATNGSMTAMGGGYWLAGIDINTGADTTAKFLIYPDAATGTNSVDAFGAMLVEDGGSYIDTESSAVTVTDYTFSGSTVSFGETPLAGAVCDWTGVAWR